MQCESAFLDGPRIGSAGMHEPVQTQPGVFENDPQLQIDFILTYVTIPLLPQPRY